MYTVTCPVSGMSAVVACACSQVQHATLNRPHDPLLDGGHHPRCQMNNLSSNIRCPPESGCCQIDHDHEAAANACPGGHGDCPEPSTCRLHTSVKAHHAAAVGAFEAKYGPLADADPATMSDQALGHAIHAADVPPDECPGGHCHMDLPDCTGCHAVIISAGFGAAVLRPVAVTA